MKTPLRKILAPVLVLTALTGFVPHTSCAESGDKAGGGGEPQEVDVDAIRGDIAAWITAGGAKALKLPRGITNPEYEQAMLAVLAPHAVVIGFVDQDDERNPDLRVTVDGQPKTCRGFTSQGDTLTHLLCNRTRYKEASESERYQLIHHEYAGLAGIEKNVGASSDYSVSSQISEYLVPVTILRLAVKGTVKPVEVNTSCRVYIDETLETFDDDEASHHAERGALKAFLVSKGYEIASRRHAAIVVTGTYHDYSNWVGPEKYILLKMTHSDTGFHLKIHGEGTNVVPDPLRARLEEKKEKANSVAEFQAVQAEIDSTRFKDIPGTSATSNLNMPTCAEFYGKRALTLNENQ